MDAFKILCAFSVVFCATIEAVPIKKYDQRQDGDLNIQAHLDKIVLLIIPSKNINILDIKGQGQFDNYDDILPLFGSKESNDIGKFKSATDLDKEKKITPVEIKDDKKEPEKRTEKPEQKDVKVDSKKPADVAPKKVENDTKPVLESQKRLTPKSDGRTYQTVHSANNRERVIAVNQEDVKKDDLSHNATKVEKL